MRIAFAAAAALLLLAGTAQAQVSTSFRGFRLEGNVGGDRFQSNGRRNDKLGYGGTVGFDGVIADRIVIGPEASYWRANNWTENCEPGVLGGTACTKSFEEYGAAVRIGFLITPQLLVFGKGGYVKNEQRIRFDAPANQSGYYGTGSVPGYQVGGGAEFSLTDMFYVSGQYVYNNYEQHDSRQRAMLGVGIRLK